MRTILATLIFLHCKLATASGWGDYSLPIDSDYEIVRCNSLDVVLATTNHTVVLGPWSFPKLGPIIEYSVTPRHILTRHHGRTLRKLFAGDTLEEVDPTQVYYCITRKSDDLVSGPFDEAAFKMHGEVANLSTIHWRTPKSPILAKALYWLGSIVATFIFFMLAIRYFSASTSSSRD